MIRYFQNYDMHVKSVNLLRNRDVGAAAVLPLPCRLPPVPGGLVCVALAICCRGLRVCLPPCTGALLWAFGMPIATSHACTA